MRVIILDQVIHYMKDQSGVELALEHINKSVIETGLILSHLCIDNVDIYADFEEYLLEHLDKIQVIEVKLLTKERLLEDTLLSTHDYINRAMPELASLSEEFYQGPSSDTWHKFGQLIEGLQWMGQTAIFMKDEGLLKRFANVSDGLLDFREHIHAFEEAVEQQDAVLIGDIISYEILPKYQMISVQLGQMVDNGEMKQ